MEHQMLSLADQVFDVIERDILNGTYERGEFLTETGLSDRLGVSRTPVREAIRRLCQEHLLEVTKHGLQVVGVSPEDIRDIYEIRYRIEGLAARRVAETVTPEQIREGRPSVGVYVRELADNGISLRAMVITRNTMMKP